MAETAALAVRPARSEDLPALHALIESAYRGDSARGGWTHEADLIEGPRTSIDALAALIADPDELLLAVERDGCLIGTVQLSRAGPDAAYLGLLTVEPGLQGGGIGKQVMRAAEAYARDHFGARAIELTAISVREELIAYYERRGYARTGEVRPFPIALDPPLHFVVMRKPLG